MTNDLNALATALYVRIDDTLQASPELAPWRRAVAIAPTLSDSELRTLAVMSALLGYTSERRWLRRVAADFRGMFPYVPDQSSYNKRLRAARTSSGNRLDHVDFTPAARLDSTADNLVGDVTGHYEPRERFAFVLAGS